MLGLYLYTLITGRKFGSLLSRKKKLHCKGNSQTSRQLMCFGQKLKTQQEQQQKQTN